MMNQNIIGFEMLNEGDETGPGGPPPPPRCSICGKLLADCNNQHDNGGPTDPGPGGP